MILAPTTGLFCDGGVIGVNPSPIGGTFAWCWVVDDQLVRGMSGVAPAGKLPVTNNFTEYLAATLALESMPEGWSGVLCSDSQVTLGRLFDGWKCDGLPAVLISRAKAALARLGTVTPLLLQGHPTKADLIAGIGKKRGLPVSRWNKWADERCNEEAKRYMEQRALAVVGT